LAWIAQQLDARGIEVVVTREPGGTPLGEQLRELLLRQPMHIDTEALLMFAARREHLAQVIVPALERGAWVLCDRFTDSSFAFQGGGRQMPESRLEVLEGWVQDGLQPDLTLLFDVPLDVAQARMSGGRVLDRFEQEKQEFHARVRNAYLRRAERYPARIKIIDSSRSVEETRQRLATILFGEQ
jgi:dTMP kinase